MNLQTYLLIRGLSDFEASVANLMVMGFSSTEMQDNLNAGKHKVKTAVDNILDKLKLKTKAQVIVHLLPIKYRGEYGNI